MSRQTEPRWLAMSPDLVIFNANVITVDDYFSIAEGAAIEDTRILGVGSNSEMKKL